MRLKSDFWPLPTWWECNLGLTLSINKHRIMLTFGLIFWEGYVTLLWDSIKPIKSSEVKDFMDWYCGGK